MILLLLEKGITRTNLLMFSPFQEFGSTGLFSVLFYLLNAEMGETGSGRCLQLIRNARRQDFKVTCIRLFDSLMHGNKFGQFFQPFQPYGPEVVIQGGKDRPMTPDCPSLGLQTVPNDLSCSAFKHAKDATSRSLKGCVQPCT